MIISCKLALSTVLVLFLTFNIGHSQSSLDKNTVQIAHNKKAKRGDFTLSQQQHFGLKLFSVTPPKVNNVHHWFLQIIDKDDSFVNFAKVSIDAYLEKDKTKKLNYFSPVSKLCSEGKYVVGFVKVKDSGKWILDITIDNFGTKDTITLEMMVGEE